MKSYQPFRLATSASLLLLLGSIAVQAQTLQSGPLFAASGDGSVTQLSQDHPLYDPYTFTYAFPAGPQGPVPLSRESMFEIRLTVDDEGKADDVEVIGGFYDARVERAIRESMRAVTFTPATAGGEAVEWPRLNVRLFMRDAYPPGVSEEMRTEFTTLVQLIADKDYGGAERFANNLLEDNAVRLFELALIKDQLATVYAETNRIPQALLASRIATARTVAVEPAAGSAAAEVEADFPDEFLTPELYHTALTRHFVLALLGNQTGEALQVHAALQASAAQLGQQAQLAPLTAQVDALQTLLNSEEPIGSAVELVDGSWEFTMSNRRVFGVTGLQGEVNFIDVNCGSSAKRRMAFQNDSEWRIPDSWGQCALEFQGDEGSKFNLFEYLN